MSTIFLSHSSADNALAERLKGWIGASGHAVFLDIDLDAGIQGGSDWEQTLYEKLQRCQVVIALLTPAWLASKWCFAEVVQARAAGKVVLPLKAVPCDASGVFPDTQQIDLTRDEALGRRRLEVALRDVVDWNGSRPPYPGLMSFGSDDEAVFFGRAPEVLAAGETLESLRHSRAAEGRLVLVLGASGSGKSSLVCAGVLPRLARRTDHWLMLPVFRPGLNPIDELSMALAAAFARCGASVEWRQLRAQLGGSGAPAAAATAATAAAADATIPGVARSPLVDVARELLVRAGRPQATVLLVLDQAEELFGVARTERAEQFLMLLRAALGQPGSPLMVLATMRSDFLPQFQGHPFVVAPPYPDPLRYTTITVEPMPLARFREVILGPARLAGITVAPELVERMVADTGSRDALPLLAFVLRKLWDAEQARGGDNRFDLAEYLAVGGVAGAVRRSADEALEAGNPGPVELAALHEAFVPTLVRVSAEGERVRRRAFRDEIPRRAEGLIGQFVARRLLVADTDTRGRETLEVAHEALLRTWPKLDEWIEVDFDKLRLLENLRRHAAEWHGGERTGGLLLHMGERLQHALELTRESRFALAEGGVEAQYLQACQEAERARIATEREEQERRLRDAERIAQEQANVAEARKKTTQRTLVGLAASLVLAVAAGLAFLTARQALRAASEEADKTREALQRAGLAFNEARKAKDEATPWIVEATWRSGAEYRPAPGYVTGVRKLIEHADPIINLTKMKFLSPHPVFLSGPHGDQFDWQAKDFARYNPQFVRWAGENLVPAATNKPFRAATQAVYDNHLATLAQAYCISHVMLQNDRAVLEQLKSRYLESVKAGTPEIHAGPYSQFFQAMDVTRGGVFPYYADVAARFWVRREIDGTAAEFSGVIRKLLQAYDAEFAAACAAIKRPFSDAMADAFPGAWMVDSPEGRAFFTLAPDGRLTLRRGARVSEHRWSYAGPGRLRVDDATVTFTDAGTPIQLQGLPLLPAAQLRFERLAPGRAPRADDEGIDARTATDVNTSLGTFRQTTPGLWRGPDGKGGETEYSEIGRRPWSIHLMDERTSTDIELDMSRNAVTAGKPGLARERLGSVTAIARPG
jgi:hypothetical protein